MVHIEDNSHFTRSVYMDDSWWLGKTMNQQDGNLNGMVANIGGAWCPVYIQYMQLCIGHSS